MSKEKRYANWVTEVTVYDPDTGGAVELSVYKHENGGMFAIDSSFVEQVLDDDNAVIQDPLETRGRVFLTENVEY